MHRRDFLTALLGAMAARAAFAQQAPEIIVPFVPTPQVTVDEMLRIAGVGPADFVLDLGSYGAGVRARDDGENGERRPLLWPGWPLRARLVTMNSIAVGA